MQKAISSRHTLAVEEATYGKAKLFEISSTEAAPIRKPHDAGNNCSLFCAEADSPKNILSCAFVVRYTFGFGRSRFFGRKRKHDYGNKVRQESVNMRADAYLGQPRDTVTVNVNG